MQSPRGRGQAGDKRSVRVTLTDEGRRRYEQATPLWHSAQDQVAEVLGAAVADELRDQLAGIAQDDRLTTYW